MPKFTKKVEFNAYQFNPEKFKGLDDYEIEDAIIAALEISEDIKHAFVTDKGTLYIAFYAHSVRNDNDCFELNPTDWLTTDAFGDFIVIPDEEFREFATPAQ